jgi:hypothetical protein
MRYSVDFGGATLRLIHPETTSFMTSRIAVLDYVVHEELAAFSAMGALNTAAPEPQTPQELVTRDPASSPVIDKLQDQLAQQRQAEAGPSVPTRGFVLH